MMQVSRKVDYALRALLYLALRGEMGPIPVSEISVRRRIPRKFLEKIIADLIRARLVRSHRGAHGGYTLTRPADQITFRDVIEAVEGPISLNVCVTEQRDCAVRSTCTMQQVWLEGQRRMLEVLEWTTLAAANLPSGVNPVARAVVQQRA